MAFPLVIIASSATTAATVRNVAMTTYVGMCMARDAWATGKELYKRGQEAKAAWDQRKATKAQEAQATEHQAQSATA